MAILYVPSDFLPFIKAYQCWDFDSWILPWLRSWLTSSWEYAWLKIDGYRVDLGLYSLSGGENDVTFLGGSTVGVR